ncbi:hypothetical protein OF83DRAFT_56112 [Amylostereum chailletii]|nr:hypothetical protein OF83DRAFT_56112 [Amylostereum chailletii]
MLKMNDELLMKSEVVERCLIGSRSGSQPRSRLADAPTPSHAVDDCSAHCAPSSETPICARQFITDLELPAAVRLPLDSRDPEPRLRRRLTIGRSCLPREDYQDSELNSIGPGHGRVRERSKLSVASLPIIFQPEPRRRRRPRSPRCVHFAPGRSISRSRSTSSIVISELHGIHGCPYRQLTTIFCAMFPRLARKIAVSSSSGRKRGIQVHVVRHECSSALEARALVWQRGCRRVGVLVGKQVRVQKQVATICRIRRDKPAGPAARRSR